MSTNDERALENNQVPAQGGANSDFDRVLQLIAAQIDDADRRQAQVLEQLASRLERLESATTTSRGQSTEEVAHQQNDAQLASPTDAPVQDNAPIPRDAAGNFDIPEWSADEDEAHAFLDSLVEKRSFAPKKHDRKPSGSPSHQTPAVQTEQTEQDVWADNAADLDYAA